MILLWLILKKVDQATDDADFVLDYALKNAKRRTRFCL